MLSGVRTFLSEFFSHINDAVGDSSSLSIDGYVDRGVSYQKRLLNTHVNLLGALPEQKIPLGALKCRVLISGRHWSISHVHNYISQALKTELTDSQGGITEKQSSIQDYDKTQSSYAVVTSHFK